MAKEVTFTPEELVELKTIKESYDSITVQLGQLELEQILLASSKEKVMNQFKALREQETTLADKLTAKYGKGKLNLETGVFASED